MDKMKRSFCFKKDMENHTYNAHVEAKQNKQRQKTMLRALNAPMSPPGSEDNITPPGEWKSKIQWSDSEDDGGATPPSWHGAQWDE